MGDRGIGKKLAHALLCCSALGLPAIAAAQSLGAAQTSQAKVRLDIPAKNLGVALSDFARQSNQQLLYAPDLVRGKTSTSIDGQFTPEEGLRALLVGTNLHFSTSSSGAFLLSAEGNVNATATAAAAGATDDSASQPIIVTAEKRQDSARNVPMGLTVLAGQNLTKRQSFRLQDFAGNLPGLSFTTEAGGALVIVSRGLTVGSDLGSMTAVYLDETPVQTADVGVDFSNFDTYDLARVEFLKGPQGTLYGADAAGGLLKYVTNAPDPSGFQGSVQAGLSGVYRAGQLGSDLHGMINVPLSDNSALRFVGYNVYYPGFTDDLSLGAKDINWARSVGGRGTLLWRPSDKLSIRFSALYHRQEAGDWDYGTEDVYAGTLTPVDGPLIQNRLETRQPSDTSTAIGSLIVNWDLGFADLSSESSFYKIDHKTTQDVSAYLEPLSAYFFPIIYGFSAHDELKTSTITQEVRVSSKDSTQLQWFIGGYFSNQHRESTFLLCPVDLVTHQDDCDLPTDPNTSFGTGDPLGGRIYRLRYRESAIFGNVDYHISPEFDVGVGGRYSFNVHKTSPSTLIGPFGTNFVGGFEGSTVREGVFQYSADARWHPTARTMVYARLASGYQPGGANEPLPGIPPSYKSSTTTNYEMGLKTSLPEIHLTADMAVYHINWRDIGVFVQGPNAFQSFIANAAGAHSNGAELQLNFTPMQGLTIVASGSYDHAYLTALGSNALIGARVGDRLPHVPRWQGALDVNYEKHAFEAFSGFLGANWTYNSSRLEFFPDPRPVLPAYAMINLRAGLESDKYSFTVYAKNVTNGLAPNSLQQNANTGWLGPLSSQGLLPRTFGATLAAKF